MSRKVNELVMEAIESGDGLTRDEIGSYVKRWSGEYVSEKSIGQTIRTLREFGKIALDNRGRYVMNNRPNNPFNKPAPIQPYAPAREGKTQLPSFQGKREGHMVTLEQNPLEVEDVVKVELCINNSWVPLLMQGALRICIGSGVPKWHPSQETLTGVKTLKLTMKDGREQEFNLDATHPLTIAPGL